MRWYNGLGADAVWNSDGAGWDIPGLDNVLQQDLRVIIQQLMMVLGYVKREVLNDEHK